MSTLSRSRGLLRSRDQESSSCESFDPFGRSPAGERPNGSKDSQDDDSWSLDLNNPLDRESVDKSISFHDL